jgi:hypothetical protein
MARWARGADRIEELIARGELQQVSGSEDAAGALFDMSGRHIAAATRSVDIDPEGAYALAYDTGRKAATAVLVHHGLRPTTRGGHIAVVEAAEAQFPGVPGLKSLDRLRRRRNQTEYPDPAGYDPNTADEAHEAIKVAAAENPMSRTRATVTRADPTGDPAHQLPRPAHAPSSRCAVSQRRGNQ